MNKGNNLNLQTALKSLAKRVSRLRDMRNMLARELLISIIFAMTKLNSWTMVESLPEQI